MNARIKTFKTRPMLKLWQILLLSGIVFALSVFFIFRAANQAPTRPLVLEMNNLTQAQIASLQEATHSLGEMQFFGANLTKIHRVVSGLSWVGSASVKRDWQKGVVVSVIPRRAVANFGSQHLLDANGEVFVPADERELMNESLVNLYSTHAKDAQHMMKQMRRINEWFSPLGLIAQDVTLTSRQTWLIRFNNGLRVIVDHENTEQKLFGLASLLKSSLASELPSMQSVDLRYKNGFAVAWRTKVEPVTNES
ncbi:cell division protein FtsQ/DivIB [Moraxella haemolytica]|uniref:cell division protein FtsQ/DivIB n=1 Tax=Moraxella TaxID=475 RepID=UPI002543ECFE|nr:cell division protein FtsQ/DivIB [Moraxella sp. ZY171148]WII94866.1 cell division protein FtsQ/DivIB [Moraxella sp. ZY171148]